MVRPEPRCLGAWGLPRVLLPPFPWIPPPGCWGAAFCWVLGGQPWRPALCYRGLLQDGLPPSPTPLPFSFPRLETSNHCLALTLALAASVSALDTKADGWASGIGPEPDFMAFHVTCHRPHR
jgi:hypothetical protein